MKKLGLTCRIEVAFEERPTEKVVMSYLERTFKTPPDSIREVDYFVEKSHVNNKYTKGNNISYDVIIYLDLESDV